jgi:hypothetical protein
VVEFESLEGKTLLTTVAPAADHVVQLTATAAIARNPLSQLSFLIGRWNSKVRFPNGAASPELQTLNYRFNRNHSAIIVNEVVLTRPRVYVSGVIAVDPANGEIVETAHDSAGLSVVQVWTPTVPGSFVITTVKSKPSRDYKVSTTLSRFGPNAYIYARQYVYPNGTIQVEAIGSQSRSR